MLKIYLDMDGVIANFDKSYDVLTPSYLSSQDAYFSAVLDHQIFEHLELLPNALALMQTLESLQCSIEILSALGTSQPLVAQQAKAQKVKWLAKHRISYPQNFTYSKYEKSHYAGLDTLLIDDNPGCTGPFIAKGGKAILYRDQDFPRNIDGLLRS